MSKDNVESVRESLLGGDVTSILSPDLSLFDADLGANGQIAFAGSSNCVIFVIVDSYIGL
jgi:hypothetical protein